MSLEAAYRAIAQGYANAADALAADAPQTQPTESAAQAPAKRTRAAAKPAPVAAEPAQPAASVPPVAATAPAAPAAPTLPAAPSVSKEKLNKAVLAVAGVNREKAIELLGRFGVTNTATLPVDKYQAVLDVFEEEKARLDAASVQASLV